MEIDSTVSSRLMTIAAPVSWEIIRALSVGICTLAWIMCCLDCEPRFMFMYLASLLWKGSSCALHTLISTLSHSELAQNKGPIYMDSKEGGAQSSWCHLWKPLREMPK